jgi:peptide/nickel transport system permease protein
MGNALRRVGGRTAESLITLALLVTLAFALAHAVPGGPAYSILGLKARPVSMAAVDMQLGLDVPVWRQYVVWWGHLLHGDFGTSYLLNRPVAEVIGEYAGNTLALDAAGLGLAVLLGLAAGVVHGVYGRRWPGRLVSGAEILFYAMPGFFTGALLLMVFSVWLRWLPAGGVADLRLDHPGVADRLRHLVLPACSLMLLGFAGVSRVLAQSMRTESARDYVRSARARGLRESTILWRHIMPNALRPAITLLGISIPGLFAGSVVVESVFSYPGLGWLLWRSALAHDYPVLVALVLLVGVATIVGNLLADLLNSWLDPVASYV